MKGLLIALSVMLLLSACQSKGTYEPVEIGKKSPGFSLKDLDGKTVNLSDFEGKVVILDFWATWCPPCREAIPDLNELHRRFLDKDFALLAISVDEGRNITEKLSDFTSEYKSDFRILISDDLTKRSYGVTSIPVMYILDKQHIIQKKHTGYNPDSLDTIIGEIEDLL